MNDKKLKTIADQEPPANTNVTPIRNALDLGNYPKLKVKASELFPDAFPDKSYDMDIPQYTPGHVNVMPRNEYYVPPVEVTQDLLSWVKRKDKPFSFGLVGPTGTGKTELPYYLSSTLNMPVYVCKINAATMPEDLEGTQVLSESENGNVVMTEMPGPVLQAYENGGLLIIDEIDKANEATQAALYAILEGKPFAIERFGRTVQQHPDCMIVVTSNTTGSGGDPRYHTSQKLDDALRARIGWHEMTFPSQEEEVNFLRRRFKKLSRPIITKMVKLATSLRASVSDDKSNVQLVISPRTLANWCSAAMMYGKRATLRKSLKVTVFGTIDAGDEETHAAVETALQAVFKGEIDESLETLINRYPCKPGEDDKPVK
ncbi:MAG: AAA domain-containing protein [Alteromonadaceae bacterium]|nr:AAA domain-containing protein [Alteromonadaceae bacterium]